jgi:galactose mutarotase-like enzyme
MEHRSLRLNGEKTLNLSHELFEKDAIIFDELKSRSVKVYHKDTRKGVEVAFQQFPYLILWSSANHGPFIAVEPWSGLSTCSDEDDSFENKRNTLYVSAGDVKELSFSITII